MTSYGRVYCNQTVIQNLNLWDESVWYEISLKYHRNFRYYDGIRVYYQVYDHTGDPSWKICAGYVRDVYRPYALSATTGYRVFPHGLYRYLFMYRV